MNIMCLRSAVFFAALVVLPIGCKDNSMKYKDYDRLVEDTLRRLKSGELEPLPPLLIAQHVEVSKYPLLEAGKTALESVRKAFSRVNDIESKVYLLRSMFYMADSEVCGDALVILAAETDEEICRTASSILTLCGDKELLPSLVDLLQEDKNSTFVLSAAENIAQVHMPMEKQLNLSEQEEIEKRKEYFLNWWYSRK